MNRQGVFTFCPGNRAIGRCTSVVAMSLSFCGTALGDGWPAFDPPAVFPSVPSRPDCRPLGMFIADIVGDAVIGTPDGKPDVVVVNSVSRNVTVFKNTGVFPTPGLQRIPGSPFSLPDGFETPYDVDVADIDSDLDLDFVVTTDGPTLVLFTNNGNGVFTGTKISLTTAQEGRGITIADFDMNTKLDIAVAGKAQFGTSFRPAIELLWQETSGAYTHQAFVMSTGNIGLGAEIVKGEIVQPAMAGRNDLVMNTYSGVTKMLVIRNESASGTRSMIQLEVPANSNGQSIVLGDFRQAAKQPDLSMSSDLTDGMDVYFAQNSGNLDFQLPAYAFSPSTANQPYGNAIGRFDPDGRDDVVVAAQGGCCSGHGGVVIFTGLGDGTFAASRHTLCVEPLGAEPKPCFVKVADMDLDGFDDIITSNTNSGNVSVLINAFFTGAPGGG